MPQPEVLPGLRAPRTVRIEAMHAAAEAAQVAPSPAAGTAGISVYVSKYRRYRVQVTAPQSYVGPDGRKHSGGKRLEAQFDEGVFRNDHRDPAVRALFDEALQANPYFGVFGSGSAHFWLASDQQARMEKARIESALNVLKSLPKETVEQYAAALKQGAAADHALPALDAIGPATDAPVGKASVRPIPPAQ